MEEVPRQAESRFGRLKAMVSKGRILQRQERQWCKLRLLDEDGVPPGWPALRGPLCGGGNFCGARSNAVGGTAVRGKPTVIAPGHAPWARAGPAAGQWTGGRISKSISLKRCGQT